MGTTQVFVSDANRITKFFSVWKGNLKRHMGKLVLHTLNLKVRMLPKENHLVLLVQRLGFSCRDSVGDIFKTPEFYRHLPRMSSLNVHS